ncbi:uncharacterized protein LOC124635303 [Helicoverpa zea]|uniref:uncharacterized protein LOC124635303 n=1 Tax=Helicoverpa zea TaxID=7113 RepID=UPI001F570937|nr:uncharacterized protein LOC124635303 [Helicoverpa zea]
MSKSILITVLALAASVCAKPYVYSYNYGTLPYTSLPYSRAAYTAADLYNPAVAPLTAAAVAPLSAAAVAPLSAAAVAPLPATYPAYSAAYGAYSAPLTLPAISAYGSSYSVEELASLINPATVYASPYNYLYK